MVFFAQPRGGLILKAAPHIIGAASTRDGFGSGGRPALMMDSCDSMGAFPVEEMHENNIPITWGIARWN